MLSQSLLLNTEADKIDAKTEAGKIDAKMLHMVDGRYYNLIGFAHPGGALVLEQSRGTDITALVASHHFSSAPYCAMAMLEVQPETVSGEIERIDIYSFDEKGFYKTCKRRVVALLGTGEQGVRGGVTAFYKAKIGITLAAWVASWCWCCFCPMNSVALVACAACGVLRLVLIGIGHESIHGRIRQPWMYLIDLFIFFPAEKWHKEHVLCHHPHCKSFDLDPDEKLAEGIVRLNKATPWKLWHSVNIIAQILASAGMGFFGAIEHYIVPWKNAVPCIVMLILTQFLPMLTHPDGFYAGCTVYFFTIIVSNLVILHAFHVTHINHEASEFALTPGSRVDWGEYQLRTTCNWAAMQNCSVTGMLEMQIEHHLFPALTYAQQSEIRPVVKLTAKEFNIPYYEYRGLFHGLWAHIKYMYSLSRSP